MAEKIIIFSAPSGAGKTTIVQRLMTKLPQLAFSISATSRPPRGIEKHDVDYYFLDVDAFKTKIAKGDFLEWEEVYTGIFYGSLKEEVSRIHKNGKVAVFDIDVVGGLNVKKQYGDQALAIFIRPPSVEALKSRLKKRGTDAPEVIAKRVAKAEKELAFAPRFDHIIVNEDIEKACQEAETSVREFLENKTKE